MIDERMWDDPDFVSLGKADRFYQVAWVYLLTGPEAREACPGLMRMTATILGEGLRCSSQDADNALRRLAALGWLDIYADLRIVHIPKAPAFRGKAGGHIIRGWYRKWQRVPDCHAKIAHPALMEPCRPKGEAWAETFGAEPRVELIRQERPNSEQKSLFPAQEPSEHSRRARERTGFSIIAGAPRAAPLHVQVQDPEQEQLQEQDPRADEPSPVQAASELWALQEILRAEFGLPPLAEFQNVEKVRILLGQYTQSQLEHVLRVFARQVREDPKQRDWFDGRKNWAPLVIEQRLGMSADPTPARRKGGGMTAADAIALGEASDRD